MSALINELDDSRYLEEINEVQFGLFDPKLIKSSSVAEITQSDTYDGNEPKANGLFDPRMGIIDRGRLCPTDENNSEICPGYFGHISLALPVFQYQFMDQVIKILRCVCYRCSSILFDKNDKFLLDQINKKKGIQRFTIVYSECFKNKKCYHCNIAQPKKYQLIKGDKVKTQDNIVKILAEIDDKSENMSAKRCYDIFKNISEEDCNYLGFNTKYSRPDWMICTELPVAPPAVRPSVRQDNNQRAEDDLTYAIANIIKANKSLRQKIESKANSDIIDNCLGLLQYYIATLIDNEIPNISAMAQRSGRPLKTILQRIKSKEGRIRGNLMGKRVDFSARTVITVDPNMNIDQYGVPKDIAMNLTFPEVVTSFNKSKLYKLVRNGPMIYPGASSVKKHKIEKDGSITPSTLSLKYVDRESIILEDGDIVYRHLQDGDIALFNRQPSLHRMSMMAHKIKVISGKTFRLNVTVCNPYNADFDGDEMNMHIPQSIMTRCELEKLTLVPTQIISPGDSKPIIYIVQDTLMGAYLFTLSKNRIYKTQLNNILMFNKDFKGILPEPLKDENGLEYWTGQQVYSLILPDITFKQGNDEDDLEIENGKVIKGILEKIIYPFFTH